MKNFEILPTEENLILTLKKNLLSRNKDLVRFYELISLQEDNCSIALDGRWGSGKTFFVKQSVLMINANNPVSDMDDDTRIQITRALNLQKREKDASESFDVAVYYDAWENDNDIDPILSIVYEIVKQLGINYSFKDNDAFMQAGSVLEVITNRNITGMIENLKSSDPLKKIKEEKDLQEKIKAFFTELLEERGNRLIVFIDELDRCKPSYAVQLLERIKHYLSDGRITFVFSVNLSELQHTIRRYYGNMFDASRYLDRFFNLRISLPPADKTAFYGELGLNSLNLLEKVSKQVINTYNMELREAVRFYRQVKTSAYEPTHQNRKWNFSYTDGQARMLLLMYVIPVVIGLKIIDISLYYEFISGKNVKPLMDIYRDSDIGMRLAVRLLDEDESMTVEKDRKLVTVEQKLQQLYDATFVTEYTSNMYNTILGSYEFDSTSKNFVKDVESMLSDYADYSI